MTAAQEWTDPRRGSASRLRSGSTTGSAREKEAIPSSRIRGFPSRMAWARAIMDTIEGRVAVITGSAGGIGLGMARAFSDAGMRLALADIDEDRLATAVAELREAGAEVVGVPTDVTDRAAVEALADSVMARFGSVHLLCNNAGLPLPRSVLATSPENWERGLAVNLFGVINGVQTFLPIMESRQEGHINTTSSMSGLIAFPPVAVYNVAKFGVIALMETLARELRETGSPVEVSVFCPGEVATHGVDNALRNAGRFGHMPTDDEVAVARAAQDGLLRSGMDPDEAGRIVLDGVTEGRFWIFSHPQWVDGPVRARFEAMVSDGSLPAM